MTPFSQTTENLLLATAAFGLLVPNGLFLYAAATRPELVKAALANSVALAFMLEALVLLVLFGCLIRARGFRSPGWSLFVVWSLVGGLAFSVPFFLWRHSRKGGNRS
jgi:hypothetical protein